MTWTREELRVRRALDPDCRCDPWNYEPHGDPGCPLSEGAPLGTEPLYGGRLSNDLVGSLLVYVACVAAGFLSGCIVAWWLAA